MFCVGKTFITDILIDYTIQQIIHNKDADKSAIISSTYVFRKVLSFKVYMVDSIL